MSPVTATNKPGLIAVPAYEPDVVAAMGDKRTRSVCRCAASIHRRTPLGFALRPLDRRAHNPHCRARCQDFACALPPSARHCPHFGPQSLTSHMHCAPPACAVNCRANQSRDADSRLDVAAPRRVARAHRSREHGLLPAATDTGDHNRDLLAVRRAPPRG